MSTRYHRITLEFNVEFEGPGSTVFEPTLEDQDDPVFRAFIAWLQEKRLAALRAEMARNGPGDVLFL